MTRRDVLVRSLAAASIPLSSVLAIGETEQPGRKCCIPVFLDHLCIRGPAKFLKPAKLYEFDSTYIPGVTRDAENLVLSQYAFEQLVSNKELWNAQQHGLDSLRQVSDGIREYAKLTDPNQAYRMILEPIPIVGEAYDTCDEYCKKHPLAAKLRNLLDRFNVALKVAGYGFELVREYQGITQALRTAQLIEDAFILRDDDPGWLAHGLVSGGPGIITEKLDYQFQTKLKGPISFPIWRYHYSV